MRPEPTLAEAWRQFDAALQNLARASSAVQRALDHAAADRADRAPSPVEVYHPDRMLRLGEAAELLGCSSATVRRFIVSQGLPVRLVGTRQRIRAGDLAEWIDARPGTHTPRGRR